MKFSVTGLDNLTKELDEVAKAVASLDGTITTVKFDPSDPVSVDRAIRDMESAVDRKAARYRSNPLVANLAKELKATYAKALRDRALRERRPS